jgi:hypothetical protein
MISFAFLFTLGFICLGLGLVLGVAGVFRVLAGQGRVRGYPHSILSILLSTAAMMGLVVVTFAGTPQSSASPPTERRRAASIPEGYVRLWQELPPREWFQGQFHARNINGPASGKAYGNANDGHDLSNIVRRSSFDGFKETRILDMTIRDQLEKETGEFVRIWFAALDRDPTPRESGSARRMPGAFIMTRGRVIMGIHGPKELVEKLADVYAQRMRDIPADKLN